MWQAIQSWASLTILISLALSIVGIVSATLMILWMPATHFLETDAEHSPPISTLRVAWLCFKNTLGVALILLGAVMMIAPGPGLLGILLGISLLDLPAKHRLLHMGLRLKSVRKTLNWIRRRGGQPPLKFPPRRKVTHPDIKL